MIEYMLALLIGLFFATSIYLFLSKSLVRLLLAVALLGNAVNLLIFTVGRVTREIPPIIPEDLMQPDKAIANPLPQALILTAIVIGFSLFAFLLVLVFRAYAELETDNTDDMREAEPLPEQPPLSY